MIERTVVGLLFLFSFLNAQHLPDSIIIKLHADTTDYTHNLYSNDSSFLYASIVVKNNKLYNAVNFTENGDTLNSGSFKNGSGNLIIHHFNKDYLKVEGSYVNGIPTGNFLCTYNWKKSKSHQLVFTYENGIITKKELYDEDKRLKSEYFVDLGIKVNYPQNNTCPKIKYLYRENSDYSLKFFPLGKGKINSDNMRVGIWKFENNDTTWVYYHDSSSIKSETFIRNTLYEKCNVKLSNNEYLKHGETIVYDTNQYQAGSYEKGNKVNEWRTYDSETQTLLSIENYDNDLLNGRYTEFYSDQKLKLTGFYQKGIKNGSWKSYYSNGNLKSEKAYSGEQWVVNCTSLDNKEVVQNDQKIKLSNKQERWLFELLGEKSEITYNVRNGVWLYYNENGQKEYFEIYKDGVLKRTKRI